MSTKPPSTDFTTKMFISCGSYDIVDLAEDGVSIFDRNTNRWLFRINQQGVTALACMLSECATKFDKETQEQGIAMYQHLKAIASGVVKVEPVVEKRKLSLVK